MDEQQRRVFVQMIGQIRDFRSGAISLGLLSVNLRGLIGAADVEGSDLFDEFLERWAPLKQELEFPTADSARGGAPPTEELEAALRDLEEWIGALLAHPSKSRD